MAGSAVVRGLSFFLCFTLDVKVKAEVSQQELLQEPRACLEKNIDCSLGVLGEFHEFKRDGLWLTLPEKGILARKSGNWKLLSGPALVHGLAKEVQFLFQLGEITSLSETAAFLLVPIDPNFMSWKIQVTHGQIQLNGGSGENLVVGQGFELVIRGYDAKGQLIAEVPQVLDLRSYVSQWGLLFKGSRKEFISELKSLQEIQKQAVEVSSAAYSSSIHRKTAAFEEVKRLKAQALWRKEKERAELEALFRKKNFLDF